jgi:hypothetical protein
MNSANNIIKSTLRFIVDKYIKILKKSGYSSIEIKRKFIQPEESIIKALAAAQPYYVADEVLYFYLEINNILAERSGYLLSEETSMFPLFPFSYVMPLAPLNLSHQIALWENIEPHICLFMGENFCLYTPRLNSKQATAPIYCSIKDVHDLDEDEGILCYSSLTNLLLMVSECYETGAYYFYKPSTYGSWREDFSKSEPIFYKYHPGLPFRSPHELSHFLDDYRV